MIAGIIAAGDGLRLRDSHPHLVKPLVPVAGTPLCHWVVGSLRQAGISDFTVLFNSKGRAVSKDLEACFPKIRWSFLVADTASSWESFRLICQDMARRANRFVISTVDSLIPPAEAARFTREMESRGVDAGLALTGFIDDEKPLWAQIGADGSIAALGQQVRHRVHATSGLYYMTARLARRMPETAAHNCLRRYWTALVSSGARVGGVVLSKTIDVDRPQDIKEAESFLKELSQVAPW
ncbi:MAG: hypothetical protein A3J74_05140 [Elusimicrobia bacterium RIFCSPHIGHO2_02_FULL_57_9]|nr:MAG: hypothetical protein A3J74_05140 [Elusimicrobia bacterium RIFCSPHIGHO2_02_FULL_57_9]